MKDILNHLLKCNLFRNIPLYERKIRIGIFSKFEVLSPLIFGRKKLRKRSKSCLSGSGIHNDSHLQSKEQEFTGFFTGESGSGEAVSTSFISHLL